MSLFLDYLLNDFNYKELGYLKLFWFFSKESIYYTITKEIFNMTWTSCSSRERYKRKSKRKYNETKIKSIIWLKKDKQRTKKK